LKGRTIAKELIFSAEHGALGKVVGFVTNIRSRDALDLMDSGVHVIEVDPNPSLDSFKNIVLENKLEGLVFLPNLHLASVREWTSSLINVLGVCESISGGSGKGIQKAILISMLGTGMEQSREDQVFRHLLHAETSFLEYGSGRAFTVMRVAPPQESLLLFSAMLQESGGLRVRVSFRVHFQSYLILSILVASGG
jgi:hypothetical protein